MCYSDKQNSVHGRRWVAALLVVLMAEVHIYGQAPGVPDKAFYTPAEWNRYFNISTSYLFYLKRTPGGAWITPAKVSDAGKWPQAHIVATTGLLGDHVRNAAGTRVPHVHFLREYDKSDFHENHPTEPEPSEKDGERFWDWFYSGWTPAIPGTSPDGQTDGDLTQAASTLGNCHQYAFHGYLSGAVANHHFSVEKDDHANTNTQHFISELDEVCPVADDCSKVIIAMDESIGHSPRYFEDPVLGWIEFDDHSWKLNTPVDADADLVPDGPAQITSWRSNNSGIYRWIHPASEATNCGPMADQKTIDGTWYGIWHAPTP